MRQRLARRAGCLFGALLVLAAARGAETNTVERVPIPLHLPLQPIGSWPIAPPPDTGVEKPTGKPRPHFLAPRGVTNLALHRPVTGSAPVPVQGTYGLATDGSKEVGETNVLVLPKGRQWIQIDLGQVHSIYAIVVWRNYERPYIYRNVVVQIADDPEFRVNARTLFNNDQDGFQDLGVGHDLGYFESYEGKLIDVNGQQARCLRVYSRGSHDEPLNYYREIEIYGLP